MAELYYSAKFVLDEWNARGLVGKVPNTSTPIMDGADRDGRPPIVGSDIHNIMNRASEIVNSFESLNNSKLNTIVRVKVNGNRRIG